MCSLVGSNACTVWHALPPVSLSLSPLAGSQFQRCLNSHFGVTLSEEEQRGVLRKYDKRGTGMVNYREFCATVDNGVCVCLLVHVFLHVCDRVCEWLYVGTWIPDCPKCGSQELASHR